MQVPLIACMTAALLCVSTVATAAEPASCLHRSSMQVEVAPTPFNPALEKLVSAQLARELDDTAAAAPCATATTPSPISLVRVAVRWPSERHAEVSVEIRWGNAGRAAVRGIDLTEIPPDGHALAVAIASTELLDELLAHRAPAPPSLPPRPRPLRAAPAVPREPFGAFGIATSFVAFSHGPLLLGPDARLSFTVTPRLDVDVHFGVRAPFNSLVPATTYVFGAGLGIAPRPMSERLGVMGRVRVDGVSLPSGGLAAQETVLVPAIGVGTWIRPSSRARVIGDLAIGAPVRSESARTRGLVTSMTVALVVSF